jgi:hypothetical protein
MTSELLRNIKKAKEQQTLKKMRVKKFDPYGRGISYSFIQKWLGCRERARLAYVEGWQPKGFRVPLEFGNIFHIMKEEYYIRYPKKVSKKSFEYVFGLADSYIEKKVIKHDLTPNETNDLNTLGALVKETFKEYVKYWSTEPWDEFGEVCDDKTKWMSMEEEFSVPYKLPCGTVVNLLGKIDGTFIHPHTGNYMILENKTKGRIESDVFSEMLSQDMQTQMYTECFSRHKGVVPQGTLYNVIRVTSMKPRKNEPWQDFVDRVGCDIRNRPDHYFKRWETTLSPIDIEKFKAHTLEPILTGVVEWWESIKKNPLNPWLKDDGSVNEKHWIRPFGLYAGGVDLANDFKEIILHQDYSNYEIRESNAAKKD